jgi:hypothetical protein
MCVASNFPLTKLNRIYLMYWENALCGRDVTEENGFPRLVGGNYL